MRSLIFVLSLFILGSCVTTYEELLDEDIEEIKEYLADNNLTGTELESGVFVVIEEEGGAEKPNLGSTITIDYRGYYIDGDEFDSSYERGDPLESPLLNLIQGWQLGIPEFGKDGKGMILIPSGLGYGAIPPSGVRQNAILIFDIELIDFE